MLWFLCSMSLVAHLLSGLINVGDAQCLDDEMDLCMDLNSTNTSANSTNTPANPTTSADPVDLAFLWNRFLQTSHHSHTDANSIYYQSSLNRLSWSSLCNGPWHKS